MQTSFAQAARTNAVPIGTFALTEIDGYVVDVRSTDGVTGTGVALTMLSFSCSRQRARSASMLLTCTASPSCSVDSSSVSVRSPSAPTFMMSAMRAAVAARLFSRFWICSVVVGFMASFSFGRASDLTVRMVAFAFAGIVTSDSSQISVFVSRRPPDFSRSTPSARMRWPIETPVMTPALMHCQASSTRVFSGPGSSMTGSVASNKIPSGVAVNMTRPIGCLGS